MFGGLGGAGPGWGFARSRALTQMAPLITKTYVMSSFATCLQNGSCWRPTPVPYRQSTFSLLHIPERQSSAKVPQHNHVDIKRNTISAFSPGDSLSRLSLSRCIATVAKAPCRHCSHAHIARLRCTAIGHQLSGPRLQSGLRQAGLPDRAPCERLHMPAMLPRTHIYAW